MRRARSRAELASICQGSVGASLWGRSLTLPCLAPLSSAGLVLNLNPKIMPAMSVSMPIWFGVDLEAGEVPRGISQHLRG